MQASQIKFVDAPPIKRFKHERRKKAIGSSAHSAYRKASQKAEERRIHSTHESAKDSDDSATPERGETLEKTLDEGAE